MIKNTLKVQTYTVMHSAGEKVDGKMVLPYESFTTAPNEVLEEKVKKGWLIKGNSFSKAKSSSRKSARKR